MGGVVLPVIWAILIIETNIYTAAKGLVLTVVPTGLLLSMYIYQIALRRIRIDENGITLYGFLTKKRTILWDELNCHGYFVHATYYKTYRRFFYFSRVPLHGGVNFLGLGAMPSPTDDLLYVAEQRDVEEVIEYYYQQHKSKKKQR